MTVLLGVREDLSEARFDNALQDLGRGTGINRITVSRTRPHLVFVDYDEHQVAREDIMNRFGQSGLHGKVCSC